MSLFIKFVLVCFLLLYAISVLTTAFEKLYYIACDANERAKEEEDKNNISESVKRLYS